MGRSEKRALAALEAAARAKLARASPAALLVSFEALQLVLPTDPRIRRAKALGIELAANEALSVRADFDEGVACAVGYRKGKAPRWEHQSVRAAAADPAMQAMLDAVRRASPIDAGTPIEPSGQAPHGGATEAPHGVATENSSLNSRTPSCPRERRDVLFCNTLYLITHALSLFVALICPFCVPHPSSDHTPHCPTPRL
jgi:hypothetical protein